MEFKVENIQVYGIDETIIASKYPKSVYEFYPLNEVSEQDLKRAVTLGHAKQGSGHDCFLKGIVFQADITASHAFWIQWLRYHFNDIISSQSKMHRIMEFDVEKQCNMYVDLRITRVINELKLDYIAAQKEYREGNRPKEHAEAAFHRLIMSLPLGFMLKARITDNYLSLKSQYVQREHDKLEEWSQYLSVLETLPMFKELVL